MMKYLLELEIYGIPERTKKNLGVYTLGKEGEK